MSKPALAFAWLVLFALLSSAASAQDRSPDFHQAEGARAHAEAVEKARQPALAKARRTEDARCARKRTRKEQDDCHALVAARFDPEPLSLPALVPSGSGLALAPLVAAPPMRTTQTADDVAASGTWAQGPASVEAGSRASGGAIEPADSVLAVPAVARGDRAPAGPGMQTLADPAARGAVTTAASTSSDSEAGRGSPREALVALVHDDADRAPRGRHAEVQNELQVGPQSLLVDRLEATAELFPGSLQAGFTYRLALDDASAPHHLFGLSLHSARCADEAPCGLRWFAFAGLAPETGAAFGVQRSAGGRLATHTDELTWSANLASAGLGYSGRLLSFAIDGQLESLAIDSTRNADTAPARTAGTLNQVRVRGTIGAGTGPFSASLRIAGYIYAGDGAEKYQQVPLRGALVEDDLAGLAGAPQAFHARLEGRFETAGGLSLAASVGYLSYVGPYRTSANLVSAGVSQRIGRFRVGAGLEYENESDRTGAGYPTLFGTGTVAASF